MFVTFLCIMILLLLYQIRKKVKAHKKLVFVAFLAALWLFYSLKRLFVANQSNPLSTLVPTKEVISTDFTSFFLDNMK